MSSSKRIPRDHVAFSPRVVSVNDKFNLERELFVKNTVQTYVEKAKTVIEKKEEETLQEIEKNKEDVMKAAFKQGFEEGYQDGKQRATAEVEQALRQEYQQILDEANHIYQKANDYQEIIRKETEQTRETYLLQEKERIIDFALFLARKIIHKEIEVADATIEELFFKTIEKFQRSNEKIVVRVHPKTKEILDVHQKVQLNDKIELVIDLTIEPSDFIIETEREVVDASVHTQLENMKEYIRGALDA